MGPHGLAELAGGVLAGAQAWLFPGATLLYLLYPLVVLSWTVVEGVAATEGHESLGGSIRSCCFRRREGRGVKKGTEEQQNGCDAYACGKTASTPGCAWPESFGPQQSHIGLLLQGLAQARTFWRAVRYWVVFFVLALRLMLYALLLSPWFLRIGYKYFHDPRIRRGVRYGNNPRNYLDIYFPEEAMDATKDAGLKLPVVVTVMGGAWVIGHRLWNVLLGMRLAQANVLVVAVDYRNFPCALMHDMVEDVGCALDWVFANIASCHGDPENIMLVGQSAGAHLEAMVLLERCLAEAGGQASAPCWSPRDLRAFLGVSGPFDLVAIEPHLESRGIYSFLPHLCADGDLARCSPTRVLQAPAWQAAAAKATARLPPVCLFGGAADRSVPPACSTGFAEALRAAGAQNVVVELGKGVRHAQPVVEDPLTGGDLQVQLILPYLFKEEAQPRVEDLPPPPYPQVPKVLASLALRLMPF
uniref:BD-FAE-like domain-containing protein n=1 Tax=Pyrodinium bahamense TaxID=73915 RepID=A0A7S0AWS6_9DINO